MKETEILLSFLKSRAALLALYLMEAAVFMMIAVLYGYEGMAKDMSYAMWLVLFLGGSVFFFRYGRYRQKCRALIEVREREERTDYLPEADSVTERLYQEIIEAAEREKQGNVTALDEKKHDMADYYTMWAHQIKTPLAAMRLLLQNGAVREEIGKQLQGQLFRIEQYVDMALSYARLDSISSDLAFQKQNLYEAVKKAVKKHSALFIGSGLSFHMDEFEAYAVTDSKWFSFVVEQVLSNALKYTDKGGISIYGTDEKGERRLSDCKAIVIEDTGIGIAESDLPRIFERGFTGYNGRMDKKSTGIGLYLCRQVMDRLGFGISVESAYQKGTRVMLFIGQREGMESIG